jgi:hypothetical protein
MAPPQQPPQQQQQQQQQPTEGNAAGHALLKALQGASPMTAHPVNRLV